MLKYFLNSNTRQINEIVEDLVHAAENHQTKRFLLSFYPAPPRAIFASFRRTQSKKRRQPQWKEWNEEKKMKLVETVSVKKMSYGATQVCVSCSLSSVPSVLPLVVV